MKPTPVVHWKTPDGQEGTYDAEYQIRSLRGRITLLTNQCKTTADHWKGECAKRDAVIAELRALLDRWVAKRK